MLATRAWTEQFLSLFRHHKSILVAVSGGSDSLALLHLMKFGLDPAIALQAATVDHCMRPESAAEAACVAQICAGLNLGHKTLVWKRDEGSRESSDSARLARYALLSQHAKECGAQAVVLGHTLDDQAETVLMRAVRATEISGTGGLAAMAELATHAINPQTKVQLIRPLLDVRRTELRDYLRSQKIQWIDDPSNVKISSERVRTRRALRDGAPFPAPEALARLARLSGRTRAWLNCETARYLRHNAVASSDQITLKRSEEAHEVIIANAIANLVLVAGGLKYRPAAGKLTDLVSAFRAGITLRRTLGRALISVGKGGATFSREKRNIEAKPETYPALYDGRIFLDPEGREHVFIEAIEQFRPVTDDSLHHALSELLSQRSSEPCLG